MMHDPSITTDALALQTGKPKLLARGTGDDGRKPNEHDKATLMAACLIYNLWDSMSVADREAWIERAEVYDTPGGRLVYETFNLGAYFT